MDLLTVPFDLFCRHCIYRDKPELGMCCEDLKKCACKNIKLDPEYLAQLKKFEQKL